MTGKCLGNVKLIGKMEGVKWKDDGESESMVTSLEDSVGVERL